MRSEFGKKPMKKKILVTTYSPCIQGSYGIVQRELFSRIHAWAGDRYEIVSHGWFHFDITDPVPWRVVPTDFKQDPNGNMVMDDRDKFGEQSLMRVINIEKPDIVFALGDHYMLRHINAAKQAFQTVQFIVYMAVDGEPWHRGLTIPYEVCDHIFALSKYGSSVISPLLARHIDHIYHGVDLNMFHPVDIDDPAVLSRIDSMRRSASGNNITGDSFVIGWVGRDQFRKQIWKLWELMHYLVHGDYILCNTCCKVTLKEFDKVLGTSREVGTLRMYKPDYDYKTCWHCNSSDIKLGVPRNDVFAWSHMAPAQGDGWDPNQLGDIWKVRDKIYSTAGLTPNKGITTNELAELYRVFDIFYCMSGGEGFGIPVLESMASGVPVAYTNYSAHSEVAGDTGIPINCDWMCEMNSCYDRSLADTADAITKLLPYIEDKKLLRPLREKAIERSKSFTWDAASKKLLMFFDGISAKIKHGYGKVL